MCTHGIFYKDCKPCKRTYYAKWRRKNRKKVAAWLKRWKQSPAGRAAAKEYRERPSVRSRARVMARADYLRRPRHYNRKWRESYRRNLLERRRRKVHSQHKRQALFSSSTFIDILAVAHRQKWICCLCGLRMQKPGNKPLSATLEHRRPISRGGSHTSRNCFAAHKCCNTSKYNKPKEDRKRCRELVRMHRRRT